MAFLADALPEALEGIVASAVANPQLPLELLRGNTASQISQNQINSQQALNGQNFNNSQQLQTNAFAFQTQQQHASFANQQELQQNQFNYLGKSNQVNFNNSMLAQASQNDANYRMSMSNQQFQSDLQQSNQKFQTGLQQNTFQQQSNLMSQASSNLTKSTFLNAGLNLASNVTGGIIGAALNAQGASLARQNFDYMTGKASDALQQQGLPSWLAYSNSAMSNAFPRTSQVISGNNTFNSSIPGNVSNLPWTGSPSQISLGVGSIPLAS